MKSQNSVSSLIQASKSLIARLRTNPSSPEKENSSQLKNAVLENRDLNFIEDFYEENSENSKSNELTLKIVNEILNSAGNQTGSSLNIIKKLDFSNNNERNSIGKKPKRDLSVKPPKDSKDSKSNYISQLENIDRELEKIDQQINNVLKEQREKERIRTSLAKNNVYN